MTVLSILCLSAAAATVGALVLLDRERRRFLAAHRQDIAVRDVPPAVLETPGAAELAPSQAAPIQLQPTADVADDAMVYDAGDAMVYIDAAGRCTLPNEAARDLLDWKSGDVVLSEILAGGRDEVHALLESLKRDGVVAQHVSALADPSHAPLQISGLALRDRDGATWRAALFIRRQGAAHGPSPRPRSVSSRR